MFRIKRKHRSIGYDIGSHSLKAVEITKSASGLKITEVVLRSLPKGAVNDARVLKPAQVREALEGMNALLSPSGARVVISAGLPNRDVFMRNRALPRAPRAEARRSLPSQMQLGAATRQEEMIFDLVIQDPEGTSSEMEALCVAAKKSQVMARQNLFGDADIEVDVVDVGLCALHNLADHLGVYQPGTAIHLHVGTSVVEIAVVRDGIIQMVRKVMSSALDPLYQQIRSSGRIGSEDPGKAVRAQDEGLFDDLIDEWAETLLADLRQTVNQAPPPGGGPVQVLMSGAGAMVQGMDRRLAGDGEFSVERLDPFSSFIVSEDLPPEILSAGPIYALAVGYALRGID